MNFATVRPSALEPRPSTRSIRRVGEVLAVLLLFVGAAEAQNLRVMATGLGEGRITGSGINCGAVATGVTPVCSLSFSPSDFVTLTAAPNTGSTFNGWGGDCPDTDLTTPPNQCRLSMNAMRSVRANFTPSTAINQLTGAQIADVAADRSRSGIGDFLALPANAGIDTPAEFIAALPADYRQNWILIPRSESLQTGTAESPRILMPSADARHVFTVGMTVHDSYPGSHPNAIEFMQYDAATKNFRFHEIVLKQIDPMGDVIDPGPPAVRRFPLRPRGVSIDDKKCFACHTTRNVLNRGPVPGTTPGTDGNPPRSVAFKSKPNWDTYDSWGGMLGFNRDRIYQGTVEAAAFRKIFNLWTWQDQPDIRSIIEQLQLQPTGVPDGTPTGTPDHRIRRNVFEGGANDGHIVFGFDPTGTAVGQEPQPIGSGPTVSYEFNRRAGSSGTEVKRTRSFVTLHHSTQPQSDEGRGVELFDRLTQGPNPQRIADELLNHPVVTGNMRLDVRPIALAIAENNCFTVAGGTAIGNTQTITPALPTAVAAFFNARNGMSFDQVFDDTRRRAQSLTRRKADIQKATLDRDGDLYALDPTPFSPPTLIIDGLIQEYGAGTAGVTGGTGGTDTSMRRLRQEVFRRQMAPGHRDETVMSNGITAPEGAYADREDDSTPGSLGDHTAQVALFRYFLEPLGVSVDKWSMGVRGRSRTYTFADLFSIYPAALITALRGSLGASVNACNLANTELARLPGTENDVPTYTDIQRIFNKGCIECHGGLGYPPPQTYSVTLDLSENEEPAAGERRLWRSMREARSLIGAPACPPSTPNCPVGTGIDPSKSFLYQRITDNGLLAHPYNPFEPYNVSNPDDLADPDIADERCPGGLMPCDGPPLSKTDIETFRRWIIGGRPNTEGDPHIRTVDGVYYDFQSAGEFTLLRDEDMELQARQTAVSTNGPLPPNHHTGLSSCVSVNTAVALRVGTHRVTYQPGLPSSSEDDVQNDEFQVGALEASDRSTGRLVLRVDGQPVDLNAGPVTLAEGGRVLATSADDGVQVQYPGGTTVVITPGFWTRYQIHYMNIDVRHARAVRGVMGAVAPGEWLPALANDTWLGPRPADLSQRYVDLYQTFAESWRVTGATSLFDYAAGLGPESYAIRDWPPESPQSCIAPPQPGGPAKVPPAAPMPAAQAQGHCAGLIDGQRQANCVADVMATGEVSFAETYLETERLALLPTPTPPRLATPADLAVVPAADVRFAWNTAEAPDGGPLTYRHCVWSGEELYDLNRCVVIGSTGTPSWRSPSFGPGYCWIAIIALALWILLLIFTRRSHKWALVILLIVAVLAALLCLIATNAGTADTVTIEDLGGSPTYYWKVVAEDQHGTVVESETRRLEVPQA
ncbi:MAG: hypothetical protein AAF481_07310 [Acidobacteriota bacterium]